MTTILDIAALTPQERLDLIVDLWDSLSAEGVALPPEQESELARRAATLEHAHDDLEWAKPLLAEAIAEIERGEGVTLDAFEAKNTARYDSTRTGP